MQFPKLVIEGSGELTENNNAHSVYMKGKVSVVFDPLIGIRITLDLLQALLHAIILTNLRPLYEKN